MKRIICLLLCIILLILTGCVPYEEISLFYSQRVEIDGFTICINEKAKCCFVAYYECKEYIENQEITIPDEYNGYPIKRIGGYYGTGLPTPFYIKIPDLYVDVNEYDHVYSLESVKKVFCENYTIVDMPFIVNIGKNIDSIEFVDMDYYFLHQNNNELILYHPVVYIKCSEDNRYFYSENGKLYTKEGELISTFAYCKP